MIHDSQTNYFYLADTLPKYYPDFFNRFERLLITCNIHFEILPKTKDVWAVDYMPLQIDKHNFVQFIYNPDYLRDTIKGRKTISDVDAICNSINIHPKKSNIILDGGNVTRTGDKVIMCDKIFTENPTLKENDLIKQLQNLFQVGKLIFIPTHPVDFTGHSDGMVCFYDPDTVLINDYSKEDMSFQLRMRLSLHNAGINYIKIPHNSYDNKRDHHAHGEYINYLHMEQVVIIPVFGMNQDDEVVKQFEQLFAGQTIATIDGNDLANDGGILNSITWNIYQ